jgi:hypothetical protein
MEVPPLTLDPRRFLAATALTASLGLAALMRPVPAPARPTDIAPTGRIQLLGEPRRVGAGTWANVGLIAPRQPDGFLLAYGRYEGDELVVGEHAEDGSREAVRELGSLGYTGISNLRSLLLLGDNSFAAGWEVDHHYAGTLGSTVGVVHGRRVTTRFAAKRYAPTLGAGDENGFIGFFAYRGATYFGRWDGAGRLLSTRRLPGTGVPLQALAFRDGVLLARRDGAGKAWIDWFDASGERLEVARGVGGRLASDGAEAVFELAPTLDGRGLRARGGATPAQLGAWRTVDQPAHADAVGYGFELVMTPGGTAVAAWSRYPQGRCGVWVRAILPGGIPGEAPTCAAPAPISGLTAGGSGGGRAWVAWSRRDDPLTERRSIWVRAVGVD